MTNPGVHTPNGEGVCTPPLPSRPDRLAINEFTSRPFNSRFAATARDHFTLALVMWSTRLRMLHDELRAINGDVLEETSSDPTVERLVTLIRFTEAEIADAEFGVRMTLPAPAESES